MGYTTIYEEAQASFTEKKSEFIGHIAPVSTADEAVAFINRIKAENRKARHNVYAYVLREGNVHDTATTASHRVQAECQCLM